MSQYKELADKLEWLAEGYWEAEIRKAIAILRSLDAQEPVGYWGGSFNNLGGADLYEVEQVSAFGYVYKNLPLYAAPVAAHPPFEKGSWQHAVDDQLVSFGRTSQEFDSPHDAVRWLIEQEVQLDIARADLAAQPQQAKPLSDAEIHDISAAVYCGLDREYQDFKIEFARAIEAAHGIKGQ